MSTATLRLSTPLAGPVSKPARKRKSILARFYDALIEARMRQAMRELAMHRHLIPEDVLKKAGYSVSLDDDSAYPFTR